LNTTSGSSAWISGLVTPSIAQDVASLTAQGTLTYGGALQILDDVAKAVSASGSLSAAQFSDLETIAANLNNGITTSDDVVSLFTQAVDGSPTPPGPRARPAAWRSATFRPAARSSGSTS
jgi:hypothetical protein